MGVPKATAKMLLKSVSTVTTIFGRSCLSRKPPPPTRAGAW